MVVHVLLQKISIIEKLCLLLSQLRHLWGRGARGECRLASQKQLFPNSSWLQSLHTSQSKPPLEIAVQLLNLNHLKISNNFPKSRHGKFLERYYTNYLTTKLFTFKIWSPTFNLPSLSATLPGLIVLIKIPWAYKRTKHFLGRNNLHVKY